MKDLRPDSVILGSPAFINPQGKSLLESYHSQKGLEETVALAPRSLDYSLVFNGTGRGVA